MNTIYCGRCLVRVARWRVRSFDEQGKVALYDAACDRCAQEAFKLHLLISPIYESEERKNGSTRAPTCH